MNEIDSIQKSIRRNLEDLHLLFTNDKLTVDSFYYNEVNLALLKAEEEIKVATAKHEARMKVFRENYDRKSSDF